MQDYEISDFLEEKEDGVKVYTGKGGVFRTPVIIKKFPFNPDGMPPSLSRELLLFDKLGRNSDYVIHFYGEFSMVEEDDQTFYYSAYEPLYTNLADLITVPLGSPRVKKVLLNLLKCVDYCHSNDIILRDLSPWTVVLVSGENSVRIGDAIAQAFMVVGDTPRRFNATREYLAPEALLRSKEYSTAMDIWSLGCIFAEMVTGKKLFVPNADTDPDNDDREQLYVIFSQLGIPQAVQSPGLAELPRWQAYQDWDNGKAPLGEFDGKLPRDMTEDPAAVLEFGEDGADLLMKMLRFDPNQRITAKEAMDHPFLKAPEPENLQRGISFDIVKKAKIETHEAVNAVFEVSNDALDRKMAVAKARANAISFRIGMETEKAREREISTRIQALERAALPVAITRGRAISQRIEESSRARNLQISQALEKAALPIAIARGRVISHQLEQQLLESANSPEWS